MNWMNYHHLFYFYTIAKEGSVAKAAVKLRLGQPTLSTQLKQLEDSFGQKLFERQARGMKLTEKGRLVFQYAREIFRLGGEMVEAVNDQLPNQQVHVQVGALDSVPKSIIHSLVQAAHSAGDCYVTVVEGSRDQLLRELNAYRVDLVITNSPYPIVPKSAMQSRRLGEVKVGVFGASRFLPLRKKFPQSLAGQPIVLPTSHSQLRVDAEKFFERAKIAPRVIGETQDGALQNLLAVSGDALIVASERAVREELRTQSLAQIGDLKDLRETFWLTSSTRLVENPIATRMMLDFSLD